MSILLFMESSLAAFKGCFKRSATYRWFVAVVCGFMVRGDHLGVTSIIRGLGLHGEQYERLIHFFRSTAYSLEGLRKTWYRIIAKSGLLFKVNGRNLILGDGTKTPKEGRYMPGVKKLYQESENSAKPQYIFGHMFGGIAVVIGRMRTRFACPLSMTIQEGLTCTASWEGSEHSDAAHTIQIYQNAYHAARVLGPSYLALDRLFLTVESLRELDRLNSNEHLLDVVTRAKDSCIAYYPLPSDYKPRQGRPRLKGDSVKLKELFESRRNDFVKATVTMYGETVNVEYLCLDLQWGSGLYKLLRFVLVKTPGRGNAIFVATDLNMAPELVIETYANRFKIETMFREYKQQLGGFCYHFWTKAAPRLNRYKKKGEPNPLETVENLKLRNRILRALKATESFVLISSISMGLVQMMALTPDIANTAGKSRYLRTKSVEHVSEATVMSYLRKNLFSFLLARPDFAVSQIIRGFLLEYSGFQNDMEVS